MSTTQTSRFAAASGSPRPDPHHTHRLHDWCARHRGIKGILIAALVITLLEVFFFNFGFWKTSAQTLTHARQLPAVTDSTTELGPGLTKSKVSGVLSVTDSATSYVEISRINSAVDSLRITPTTAQPPTTANSTQSRYNTAAPDFEKWVTVRVDVLPEDASEWITGTNTELSPAAASSTYLSLKGSGSGAESATESGAGSAHAGNTSSDAADADLAADGAKISKIRVWYLQPEQSSFAFAGVGVNVRRGFSLNVLRMVLMALIAAFILGFRPGSRLYRIRLNTASRRQRRLLLGVLIPFAALFVGVVIAQWGYTPLDSWKESGDYTYDFDQYAHMADSLLKGIPWLDLPVPDALAQAANPYSTQTRAQLLSQGVSPILWDHAFWNGRWYCYFGVLPAVVFYLPVQALTSLWTPGGISVPTPDVVVLLLGLFALTGSLLVVRLITRHFPNTSLGIALLSVIGFLCGGNLFFLAFRLNFYAVPMLSSLVLSCLGLWLWLGARRVADDGSAIGFTGLGVLHGAPLRGDMHPQTRTATHYWTIRDGSAPSLLATGRIHLSKVRVGLGFLCMAANLGCRPTFVLAALLAFPLFWDEIRGGWFFSCFNPAIWREYRALRRSGSAGEDGSAKGSKVGNEPIKAQRPRSNSTTRPHDGGFATSNGQLRESAGVPLSADASVPALDAATERPLEATQPAAISAPLSAYSPVSSAEPGAGVGSGAGFGAGSVSGLGTGSRAAGSGATGSEVGAEVWVRESTSTQGDSESRAVFVSASESGTRKSFRTPTPLRTLVLKSPGNDLAALLPAIAICLPILAYNFWRFGSFLDFGNAYQLTVTDLTTYREPLSLIAPITYYYLFQPLSLTSDFPFLKLTATPLHSWQLTEPHAGGFFWLVPFALLGLVALLLRRMLRRQRLWGFVIAMLGMAAFLCVFDAYKAGLSWRYMADFGWLVSLPAVAAACGLEEWGRGRRAHRLALESHFGRGGDVQGRGTRGTRRFLLAGVRGTYGARGSLGSLGALGSLSAVRWGVAALVGIGLLITVLSCFMPGRIDNLMVNAPAVYFEVKAWFTGFLG